jgi:hypothetical protein
VDAPGRPGLVGARLEAIAGLPVREALERVTPLVPHDNPWSLAARAPQYLLVAEVLHGLGLTDAADTAEFDLVRPDGRRMTATLEPIPADAYRAAQPDLFHPMVPPGLPRRPAPPALARRLEERWTATLAGGEVVYVAYNVTLGSTSDLARGLRRLVRRPHVERIVLDLRHNPGGNNTTYGPLLHELERVDDLVVLVGRTTFSAAANLLAELEAGADPLLVGEPTGGSPNLYGDPVPVTLPESGLTAHVAGVAWAPAGPDERLAFEPDVRVELTTMDFLAGRDPALSAALRPAPR